MKKLLCFFVSALTVVTLLSGCGKKSDSTAYYNYKSFDEYVTLGEYKGVKVEVGSTDFQSKLTSKYKEDLDTLNVATTTELKSGAVQNGDTAHILFVGKKDGVAFEGGSSGDQGYDLEIGSNSFIEGFESGLIGVELGKQKDLNLTFPADYGSADLAGKPVVFTVTVQKITRKTYPELSDDLAKKLEYNSLVEYKAGVFDQVKKDFVWRKVVEASKVSKYPDNEMQKYIQQYRDQATKNGQSLEEFLSANQYTMEKLQEYIKGLMGQEIIGFAIAQKEKLTVTEDELKKSLTDNPKSDKSAYTEQEKADMKKSLLMQKAINFTFDKAVDA